MNLIYRTKFALMKSMIAKRKKEYFSYTEADLFSIPEGASPLINNSWFFGGDSFDGTSFKMRLGIRNSGEAEVFLIWISSDGKYYATEKTLYTVEDCPIKVKNIIPARDWDVCFDGEVKDMSDGTNHHLSLQFHYIARLPIFHPMFDGVTDGMAQAIASMPWNRNFFKSLSGDTGLGATDKKIRQGHFEQTGKMEGAVEIDGRSRNFTLYGIRDRAFGKRDWDYMDCHVWLVAVTEKGEACNVSIVSYPHAKRFYCGYLDFNSDRNYSIVDYKIISYDHNEGNGPDSMVIDCSFTNGKCYRITTERTHDLYLPFDKGNYYFHESVGNFIFVELPELGAEPLPGSETIKARGTIELGWNKDSSRWGTYEKKLLTDE